MVNFVPDFVSEPCGSGVRRRMRRRPASRSFTGRQQGWVEAGLKTWEAAHPRPPVTASAVADHIEHVAKVAGYDHVGLGGDLDGIPYTPQGLTGVRTIRTSSRS